jgi:Na+-translocating ferredoxin:NAD+ oxidoreductase RnfC subunit
VNAKVDTVIVNGAECEPLLYKDKEIMRLYPEDMIKGVKIVMDITEAKQGIIALKAKNKEAIPKLEKICEKYNGIRVEIIDDVYPAGDEVILVYEVTKRIVPPASIPLSVGCVVANSETFYNINKAINENNNVVYKYITLCGEVKKPITLKVPVGVTIKELLGFAGGVTVSDPVFIDGGPMMGNIIEDENTCVTKKSAGYIVLSKSHPLVNRKTQTEISVKKIGKSVCDQCSYCTEFCPRYLLGHEVRPHMVMRSLGLTGNNQELVSQWSLACVECKLCTIFSCPEMLYPGESCSIAKGNLAAKNIRLTPKPVNEYKPHPMRESRKLPTKRLVQKLGLTKYDVPAHLENIEYKPDSVKILLSQHIGVPCEPKVKINDLVKLGDLIASTSENKLGITLHASISGKITEITKEYISIKKI